MEAREVVGEVDGVAARRAVSEDAAALFGELIAHGSGQAGRPGRRARRCGWAMIGRRHLASRRWLRLAGSKGAIAHSHSAAFSSSPSG